MGFYYLLFHSLIWYCIVNTLVGSVNIVKLHNIVQYNTNIWWYNVQCSQVELDTHTEPWPNMPCWDKRWRPSCLGLPDSDKLVIQGHEHITRYKVQACTFLQGHEHNTYYKVIQYQLVFYGRAHFHCEHCTSSCNISLYFITSNLH